MTIKELINYLQEQVLEDRDSNVESKLSLDSSVFVWDGENYTTFDPDGELLGGNVFGRGICLYKVSAQ